MRDGGGEEHPATEAQEDPEGARRVMAAALAEAVVAEAVYEVLDEAQRAGVDLPDGFAERMARSAARRAGTSLRRLAEGAERKGGGREESGVRERRQVFA